MTVNRRTKKATNRQPEAPKQASKVIDSQPIEAPAQLGSPDPMPVAQLVVTEWVEAEVTEVAPATAAQSTVQSSSSTTAQSITAQSITEGSHAMSQEEVVKVEAKPAKAKSTKGEIVPSSTTLSIWDRPVMPNEVEMIGTLQMAGIRPVAASEVKVFDTYLNGRPIEASSLKLYEDMPGAGAIFFSDFHAVEGLDLPGGRPVMASAPGLMASTRLPGDRPIFANDIDNPYELMGFLD